jgi:hypothetical protein
VGTVVAARGPGWKQLAGIGALSGALILGLFLLAKWVRETSDWPTEKSDNLLLVGILVVGLIPIALVLIDALIRRGGRLSFQGITIDLAATTSRPVALRIDTNIGLPGESVGDTSSREILGVLKKSATTDIVVVDLKHGKAWWETRLLVLVAGAVRTGKPRSIVFVASTTSQNKNFLGWAPPQALLDALLDQRNPRHAIYLKARGLALETAAKWQVEIDKLGPNPAPGAVPGIPPDLPPVPPNWNWGGTWVVWDGREANPFAAEQFLALALGNELEETWKADPFPTDAKASSAEKFPNAVTTTEETLATQFADKLHRNAIEETGTSAQQVDAFLVDAGEFVAITHNGSYVRMAARSALLEGLVQQLLVSARDEGA